MSNLLSKNIYIFNHRTSIRLQPEMWVALAEIAAREGGSIHDICGYVSRHKNKETTLTAAIRVFIMGYYKQAATEEGHRRAGHGALLQQLKKTVAR